MITSAQVDAYWESSAARIWESMQESEEDERKREENESELKRLDNHVGDVEQIIEDLEYAAKDIPDWCISDEKLDTIKAILQEWLDNAVSECNRVKRECED